MSSDPNPTPKTENPRKFQPYVPENRQMREFSFRAVLIGLMMTVVLGSANAYLGLRAGMTIAATYPAAVIGMALLKLAQGSLLEENIARTVGSIGESVAAGAIFTLPAFVLAGAWPSFSFHEAYWKSVALMAVGGILGILFVTLLRRVMVDDAELPFPESVAASEIHKAGQQGRRRPALFPRLDQAVQHQPRFPFSSGRFREKLTTGAHRNRSAALYRRHDDLFSPGG
jgi:uncharacterized oligopeptide transporter (OPT) family protein